MNEDLKLYIKQWLAKAERDLLTVERLIEIEPYILDTACFHCQQAIEKTLKAYLVFKGVKITRTHSIDFLLIECGKFDMTFNEIDVKNIDDFAVLIRYPDNQIVPKISETRFFFKIAKEIKEKVEKEIFLLPGF